MAKSSMSFVKGVGAGMIAGAVVAAVGSTVMSKNKPFAKTTKKAAKAVGNIIDDIQMMLK